MGSQKIHETKPNQKLAAEIARLEAIRAASRLPLR